MKDSDGDTVATPDRIWLQVSDDLRPPAGHVHESTTWCQDKINDDDVLYLRADGEKV